MGDSFFYDITELKFHMDDFGIDLHP